MYIFASVQTQQNKHSPCLIKKAVFKSIFRKNKTDYYKNLIEIRNYCIQLRTFFFIPAIVTKLSNEIL